MPKAGFAWDAVSAETVLYIESANVAGVTTSAQWAVRHFEDKIQDANVTRVVARIPCDRLELPLADWQRTTTYVRWKGDDQPYGPDAPLASTKHQVQTCRSRSAHDDLLVERWLARAIKDGTRLALGRTVLDDRVTEYVDAWMSDPRRISYVALCDECRSTVGHATLLSPCPNDGQSSTPFMELVDLLVEDGPCASTARRALTREAIVAANNRKQDLVGNVTHLPGEGTGRSGARTILDRLIESGWIPLYALLQRDISSF